jgi:hypothetical protein
MKKVSKTINFSIFMLGLIYCGMVNVFSNPKWIKCF